MMPFVCSAHCSVKPSVQRVSNYAQRNRTETRFVCGHPASSMHWNIRISDIMVFTWWRIFISQTSGVCFSDWCPPAWRILKHTSALPAPVCVKLHPAHWCFAPLSSRPFCESITMFTLVHTGWSLRYNRFSDIVHGQHCLYVFAVAKAALQTLMN